MDRDLGGGRIPVLLGEAVYVSTRDACLSLRFTALRNNLKFLLQRTAGAVGMSWEPQPLIWSSGVWPSLPPRQLGHREGSSRCGQNRATWGRWEVGGQAETRALGAHLRLTPWALKGPCDGKTEVLYHLAFCVIVINKWKECFPKTNKCNHIIYISLLKTSYTFFFLSK